MPFGIGKSYRVSTQMLILFLVLVIFTIKVPIESFSQTLLDANIKCPDSWQVTNPGKVVTFDLSITNPSYNFDSFVLSIEDTWLPEGWKADFLLKNNRVKEIGIDPKQTLNLVLQIQVSNDSLIGDFRFTVHVKGTYSVAERTLTVTVESIPPIIYQVEVYCPVDWQVTYPNNNLTYNIRFRNLTPDTDNYLLYVANPGLPVNWTANFYIGTKMVKSFNAQPQETIDLVLEIGVPKEAMTGDYQLRAQIVGDYINASQGITVTVENIPAPPPKISLTCPFLSQSILTGQSTYYPLKVTNEGQEAEEILLEWTKSAEMTTWDITFSQRQFNLGATESIWVTLNVKPPALVKEGNYTIDVKSITADRKIEVPLQVTVNILADYLLEIVGIQPINPEVAQGDKIDVLVTVRNTGQSPVTRVRLNINSSMIPNILVTPLDILSMDSQTTQEFHLRIAPTTGITPGDYFIQVQAESGETMSTVRTIAVSVSSAIPWFWITTGIIVIATALVVIAVQKLVSKMGLRVRLRK